MKFYCFIKQTIFSDCAYTQIKYHLHGIKDNYQGMPDPDFANLTNIKKMSNGEKIPMR